MSIQRRAAWLVLYLLAAVVAFVAAAALVQGLTVPAFEASSYLVLFVILAVASAGLVFAGRRVGRKPKRQAEEA